MTEEERFRLTEAGEKAAVDSLGGQDIMNMASGLNEVIRRFGHALGPIENATKALTVWDWVVAARYAQVLKRFLPPEQWRSLVARFEADVLGETDYFNKMPSALPDLDESSQKTGKATGSEVT